MRFRSADPSGRGQRVGATAAATPDQRSLRRAVVIGAIALGVAAAVTASIVVATRAESVVTQSGLQRVQIVTPLPGESQPGTGYPYYSARPDLMVNGRSAVETFGVTDVVAMPDGTVYALQDSRISVADSDDQFEEADDWGKSLVRISADGTASLIEGPYADRALGRDVAPACASPDGDLYAYNDQDGSIVARNASGEWRAVTAPDVSRQMGSTGDGGLAARATIGSFHGCAVTSDGSVYLTDRCVVRRITADGTIDTIAGRNDLDDGSGCGEVADALASHTGTVPDYDGPAVDAELGWLSAIAAGPDDSLWISAMWGIQQITPDGRLRTTAIPTDMGGVSRISSLATLPDGSLLAAYGEHGPKGVSRRDPATGDWTTLLHLDEDSPFAGTHAPAPLSELDLYRADLSTSRDRIYFGVAYGPNAGIVAVPVT